MANSDSVKCSRTRCVALCAANAGKMTENKICSIEVEVNAGIYKNGIENFPALKEIDINELYRGVNKVEPSLIRTEADELTYSLHIMVR